LQYPVCGAREFHKGIDIATKMGVHVVAPVDGLRAEISHDPDVGMSTSYGHVLRTAVAQGTIVKKGTSSAMSGIPDEAQVRISITP
jgi:murein DD-endopeptidase MepM/ murein hydrolase activator NlpD